MELLYGLIFIAVIIGSTTYYSHRKSLSVYKRVYNKLDSYTFTPTFREDLEEYGMVKVKDPNVDFTFFLYTKSFDLGETRKPEDNWSYVSHRLQRIPTVIFWVDPVNWYWYRKYINWFKENTDYLS